MKPELVVDNSNVTSLPVGNLMDIAGMARRFADDLEAGNHGNPCRVVVVVHREDNTLGLYGWGENTTALELMGLFEAAKLRVFADDMVDDED